MANRSYIYSINEIPGAKREQTLTLKGLSEFKYGVPLAYKILLSGNVQVCDSILGKYDEPAALIGPYDKGLEQLNKLGLLMRKWEVRNLPVFEQQFEESFDFLKKTNNKQKYFYLDISELFDMSGINDVDHYRFEIELVGDAIESGSFDALNNQMLEGDLKNSWEEALGLDYWSDVLYYHFEKPIDYHSPFAKGMDENAKQKDEVVSLVDALKNS